MNPSPNTSPTPMTTVDAEAFETALLSAMRHLVRGLATLAEVDALTHSTVVNELWTELLECELVPFEVRAELVRAGHLVEAVDFNGTAEF